MHLFTPNPAAPFSPTAYFGTVVLSFLGGVVFGICMMRFGAATPRVTANRITNAAVAIAGAREEVKMTLVVRKDLKMSTGKIAAQCAHAAVAVVDEVNDIASELGSSPAALVGRSKAEWVGWLDAWRTFGSKKVTLKVESEAELDALAQSAKAAGVPHYQIYDAGRTQIAAGSATVLAVGPAPASRIDAVTGKLPVL